MKRFLLFVFSIFLSYSIAIAQDGINYQGAATDVNGDELTNQNITIRASVLSTTANGNLEWEETHSATTDQFGLFNVVIGQGTNTTNGAIASFDDMDWGSGNHFLKIEMDATGGTNYAMIGTTQMMSVPYALYAKSAGIDSTMLANMIGSSGGGIGGGCDFQFPEGLQGEPIIWDLPGNDYTVPSGKNLYITSMAGYNAGDNMQIDGLEIIKNIRFEGIMIVGAGSVVSTNSTTSASWATFNGYLVDENYFAGCGGGGSSSSASTIDSAMVAGMIANAEGGSSFGDIITINSSVETQATENGFLYGNYACGGPSQSYINIYCDTFSGNSSIRANYESNPYGGNFVRNGFFNIPIKKGEYFSFQTNGYSSITNSYFIPLESGGGSSTASTGLDSATVASMIANAFNSSISTSVGDNFQGGIVGYIFQAGDQGYVPGETHGYILYSDNTDIEWGCMGSVTGVTNPVMGQGQINTDSLVVLCSSASFAAKWCNELVIGTYDDWFLPNSEEMVAVGSSFIGNHFGTYQLYWISEEYWQSAPNNNCPSSFCTSADFAFTFYIDGSNSLNLNYLKKEGNPEKVIAFRKF